MVGGYRRQSKCQRRREGGARSRRSQAASAVTLTPATSRRALRMRLPASRYCPRRRDGRGCFRLRSAPEVVELICRRWSRNSRRRSDSGRAARSCSSAAAGRGASAGPGARGSGRGAGAPTSGAGGGAGLRRGLSRRLARCLLWRGNTDERFDGRHSHLQSRTEDDQGGGACVPAQVQSRQDINGRSAKESTKTFRRLKGSEARAELLIATRRRLAAFYALGTRLDVSRIGL